MDGAIEILAAMMLEDEGWQGGLDDHERAVCMDVTKSRFRSVIAAERVRLRDLFRRIGPALEGASSRASLFQDVLVSFGL
jgi:hypothetical protein